MKKKLSSVFIYVALFLIIPIIWGKVAAATLKFNKTSASVTVNGTFQISVVVDPGSDQINSTDAYVLYDSSVLKAQSVAAGTLFPTVSNDITTAGKIYIAGMVDNPASAISTSGTVATITFQGLSNGTAMLTFDCTTSKIVKNDINATNVMQCSQNGTAAITIGAGSTGYLTTPEPTPSVLPKTGIFDNVVNLAVPGMILLFLGYAARLIL